MNTEEVNGIICEATRRRVKLTPVGPRLRYEVTGPMDPAFESLLIENKVAVLKLLNAKRHLAKQVLANEFFALNDHDFGLISSELVAQRHDPVCALAAEYLRQQFLRENPNRK